MRRSIGRHVFRSVGLVLMLTTVWQALAQDSKTSYPTMAPLDQYLMERDTEIALARSAAPPSIADDAEVMVFGKHGYEIAVSGKNGFVCMVLRGWTAAFDDPVFWNPKSRGPACFNAAGARSFLPLVFKKAELVSAGRSKDQMTETISASINKKELPVMEPGAMCYMMSKQGYLNDQAGHWHPHLMFFAPLADAGTWGDGLPGSPVINAKDEVAQIITFMVPVRMWSDGTPDLPQTHQ
jgi:hypothetical protein